MKKMLWRVGSYYGVTTLLFIVAWVWLAQSQRPGEEAEWVPYWILAGTLFFALPAGILTVVAGVRSYRWTSPRPRTWITVLIGGMLIIPALLTILFGAALFFTLTYLFL
ncbi:MAG: hypothetical protein M0Z65_00330 [Firmicutes bacterium]|uniref:Uncharacterized protein n=1 Tax=Melghirimyces thermohalophilus TaxID=1236220 RepID=A0A1G6PSZ9_9BACL|nr:hypothetical protein [Melghirimyces thermohalophilus]MDA8351645.1 hypothetical protein [Bacillota bacterium]SDC83360.1 hypothetical protein SAMN04488112_11831 [Melghirimyces thermohalophilus]